jgi:cell division topological specificity factor
MMISTLFARVFSSKPRTAERAVERLKVLIAHEHSAPGGSPKFFPEMQRELVEVISRYYPSINPDDIKISIDHKENCEMLVVDIALPESDER